MSFQITGKLLEIGETNQVRDNLKKREFVLEVAENPRYPEYIRFELINDKCSVLDHFSSNDVVTIQFNLRGRRYTDREGQTRYYNTLQAWRVDKGEGNFSRPAGASGGFMREDEGAPF